MRVIESRTRFAVPLFEIVTVFAGEVSSAGRGSKLRDVGFGDITGVGADPTHATFSVS